MKPMPELRLVCDHTLYLARFKAPVKQSQHVNATLRNMLRAFGRLVATCWVLLAQV